MLVSKPPKETLVDEMIHKEYQGEGDYNQPKYGEPTTIKLVRIDRQPKYVFNTTSKQLLFCATIYCYNGFTCPLPEFKEQDLILFDGKEHTVVQAPFFKEPYEDRIYSYELGVI